mmetsp:Transcript_9564/g.21928  ORF Transcript_9564/g.21928 Transcript_9564/m.21928 type:complete len:206 (-) Transcript_9564:1448-2065(-)
MPLRLLLLRPQWPLEAAAVDRQAAAALGRARRPWRKAKGRRSFQQRPIPGSLAPVHRAMTATTLRTTLRGIPGTPASRRSPGVNTPRRALRPQSATAAAAAGMEAPSLATAGSAPASAQEDQVVAATMASSCVPPRHSSKRKKAAATVPAPPLIARQRLPRCSSPAFPPTSRREPCFPCSRTSRSLCAATSTSSIALGMRRLVRT